MNNYHYDDYESWPKNARYKSNDVFDDDNYEDDDHYANNELQFKQSFETNKYNREHIF